MLACGRARRRNYCVTTGGQNWENERHMPRCSSHITKDWSHCGFHVFFFFLQFCLSSFDLTVMTRVLFPSGFMSHRSVWSNTCTWSECLVTSTHLEGSTNCLAQYSQSCIFPCSEQVNITLKLFWNANECLYYSSLRSLSSPCCIFPQRRCCAAAAHSFFYLHWKCCSRHWQRLIWNLTAKKRSKDRTLLSGDL